MTTVTLSVPLNQLAAQYKLLGSRLHGAAMRGARAGALRAVATIQRAVGKAPPANPAGIGRGGAFNFGFYKLAWTWEATNYGARVYNLAPYASIIEEGRRPGARPPPSHVLILWIMRRLGKSEKEARKLAFPIARAIGKRGLKARKVMSGQKDAIEKGFWEEVYKELETEMLRAAP